MPGKVFSLGDVERRQLHRLAPGARATWEELDQALIVALHGHCLGGGTT